MSNNANQKVSNPMKVITGPDTRWSYANVWEPKSINGGAPKYSVSLIIPKSDTKTVNKIKAAIQAAYEEGAAKLKGNGFPTLLYNGQVAPIIPFTFKGMIWLQGCSDTVETARAASYLENFKRILGIWRKQFGHFPMITAQLNRWVSNNDGHLDREWGLPYNERN